MKDDLSLDELKQIIIEIYQVYLENPNDKENNLRAKQVYNYCWSLPLFTLKGDLRSAILGLFGIGYDNLKLEKPSRETVLKYIKTLKK